MAARRSHVTWVERVRQSEVVLGRDHRVKCSCGWRSDPLAYEAAAGATALHLQLAQLRNEMRPRRPFVVRRAPDA